MKHNVKLILVLIAIVFALVMPAVSGVAMEGVSPRGEYYYDDAGVLSGATQTFITERNYNLEHNCKGAQICVVVVRSIGGEDISEFAAKTFNRWQIGRADEGNGTLFLVVASGSAQSSRYWITPGTGLEELFSTSALKAIFDKYYTPNANAGDLDKAIYDTFSMLNSLVCKKYDADPAGKASTNLSGGTGFVSGGGSNNGFNFMSCSDDNASEELLPFELTSCSSSCSGCSSCSACGSFGGIILLAIVFYIAVQVLKYIGKAGREYNESGSNGSSGGRSFFVPFMLGSIFRGFADSARSARGYHRATRTTRASRPFDGFRGTSNPFSGGFRPGGGSTRGGGFGGSSGFGRGFKGGGGGTRGGGFGKR